MTTEVAEPTEAARAEEAAAMNAVFSGEPGEDTPEPTAVVPPVEATPEPAPTPAPEPVAPAAEASPPAQVTPIAEVIPPAPEFVQITKTEFEAINAGVAKLSEMQASMEKLKLDFFGKVGGLEGLIKKAQEETPVGEPVLLSLEDFGNKELVEDFKDIFTAVVEGVNKKLSKGKVKGTAEVVAPTPPPAPPAPPKVEDLVQQAEDKTSLRILDVMKPGWDQIIGLPGPNGRPPPETAYRKWLKTQPVDYQETIATTREPGPIAASIQKFKEATPAPPVPPPVDPRRARLEDAVPLKGDNQPVVVQGELTEEQAMHAAFHGKGTKKS